MPEPGKTEVGQLPATFSIGCVAVLCLLVGLLVAVFLVAHQPTIEDMQNAYFEHERPFNSLSEALIEEGRNISVYSDSSAGVSFPLTRDYEALDEPTRRKLLGLIQRAGMQRARVSCWANDEKMSVEVRPRRYISDGVATYYVFSTSEPDGIVENLAEARLKLDDGQAAYGRLLGNWYLCAVRLDFADD